MSSILSNTDAPSYTFNAFHSFDGFEILGIELPKAFDQENFGNHPGFASLENGKISDQIADSEIIESLNKNYPEGNSGNFTKNINNKSSPLIFDTGKSIIEFFYNEEKEIIKLDSSTLTLDDYEIF